MCISGPVESGAQPASDDMQAPEKKHNLPSFLFKPSSATATSFCSCLVEADKNTWLSRRQEKRMCNLFIRWISTLLSKKHNRNLLFPGRASAELYCLLKVITEKVGEAWQMHMHGSPSDPTTSSPWNIWVQKICGVQRSSPQSLWLMLSNSLSLKVTAFIS